MEDFSPSFAKDIPFLPPSSPADPPCNTSARKTTKTPFIGRRSSHDHLTDYSPSDKPWDVHRAMADDVGGIYAGAARFERYAARMAECGGVLRFGWADNQVTGKAV